MKIKSSEQGNIKDNPVFKGLTEELKDAKCFKKIEKDIEKIMFSDHSHRTAKTFIKCKRCQIKFNKKREYIKDKGFQSFQQYLAWRKVMIIINDAKDFKVQ